MLKKFIVIVVIFLFILASFPMVSSDINSIDNENEIIDSQYGITNPNNTIFVDDDNTEGPWDGTKGHPFQEIRQGVNAAVNGTTVFVYNGYYGETNIHILYKSIKLIGENKSNTIIDGKGRYCFVYIFRSNNVTFSNFTVINGSEHHMILVEESNYVIISNNIIERGKGGGIKLSEVCYSKVTNNMIRFNRRGITVGRNRHISLNNIISRNHFVMNGIGLYLQAWTVDNLIGENNFILNKKHAFFDAAKKNSWSGNFWGRPRLFPKLIRGVTYIPSPVPFNPPREVKIFRIDWHPAKEPYDI